MSEDTFVLQVGECLKTRSCSALTCVISSRALRASCCRVSLGCGDGLGLGSGESSSLLSSVDSMVCMGDDDDSSL